MTVPKVPPSVVRFCTIGGSAAASVTVQGDPQLKSIVSPGAAASIAARSEPSGGVVALSAEVVTVIVAAPAGIVTRLNQQTATIHACLTTRIVSSPFAQWSKPRYERYSKPGGYYSNPNRRRNFP
jgi:hypothetical protein